MQVLLSEDIYNFIKYFYLFFLGASIGSFYKTLLDRIFYFFYSKERKKFTLKEKYIKLFFQPSFCHHCKNKIPFKNLIPIFGYFLTKRRCSYCKVKLGFEFLYWELFGGFLIVFFYYFYNWIGFLYGILTFHFLITALIDSKKFFIDYENVFFLYFFGIILVILLNKDLKSIFLSFLFFISLFIGLYYLSKKKGLGFGDVILIGAISILFSVWEIIFILSFSAFGSILYILLYKKNKKSPAPLGAFLSLFSILFLIIQPFEYFLIQLFA